jgi:hypothetical protein
LRWAVGVALIPVLWFAANGLYQVARKPSELFFPVSETLHKSASETWRAYESEFRAHATDVITSDFLAGLAQVEASGNPVARTYWRWSLGRNPFSIYQPASSAVGLFQITDGTFEQARRYCIHDHAVVEDGPWNDPESCWFNAFYSRIIPSHAIELTAAYLHHHVERITRRHPPRDPSLRAKHELAAVIHLCGAGAAERLARRGYVLTSGQRCGTHDVGRYLGKVAKQQVQFARLGGSS